MFDQSLSGRFFAVTLLAMLIVEALIFFPSIARFRHQYLRERVERSQIASLAVLASPDEMVERTLQKELLENAGVLKVVQQRQDFRQLVLNSAMSHEIDATYDLRSTNYPAIIREVVNLLFSKEDRIIRVIGVPFNRAGDLTEITLYERPMKEAIAKYAGNILQATLIFSVFLALFLYSTTQSLMVKPIRKLIRQIQIFQDSPEDSKRIIQPSSPITELYEAERSLRDMAHELAFALQQKKRLSLLGGAVSKISHDLRNMLTTAQILVDTLGQSKDLRVKRSAPRLESAIKRAVGLCERTLAFGRAEEPPPSPERIKLGNIVQEVIEDQNLVASKSDVKYELAFDADFELVADSEQIYRVLANLIRNARQALETREIEGIIEIGALEDKETVRIWVKDNGPGLPEKAREKLFQPFEGSTRAGGTGLGLTLSAEIIRNHGGQLVLSESNENGARFLITLPRSPISPHISA